MRGRWVISSCKADESGIFSVAFVWKHICIHMCA